MTWIRVTLVPNEDNLDTPRATFLVDTIRVVGFCQRPAGEYVQMWFDLDPDSGVPVMNIGESLEQIEALIDAAERKAEERRADVLLKRGTTPDASLFTAWSGS